MYEKYLSFVQERHNISCMRASGAPYASQDEILRNNKFCSVYRVLDYGSQFFIRELLRGEESLLPEDVLYRAMLYRYYNRPEPFRWFLNNVGRYPLARDRGGLAHRALSAYDAVGGKMFGTAYTMFSGQENPGVRRWEWALGLAGRAVDQQAKEFLKSGSTRGQIEALLPLPRVGLFMAQQVVTDFNYASSHYIGGENEHVVLGPGSARGAKLLGFDEAGQTFTGFCTNIQGDLLDVSLHGRPPSLMDIQNTLCEFDKYIRYTNKTPRTRYTPAHSWKTPRPQLPSHWFN